MDKIFLYNIDKTNVLEKKSGFYKLLSKMFLHKRSATNSLKEFHEIYIIVRMKDILKLFPNFLKQRFVSRRRNIFELCFQGRCLSQKNNIFQVIKT